MSCCCTPGLHEVGEPAGIEIQDDGVIVTEDATKLSFDGGITATQDPLDPNLVHVALGGIGAVSLQLAYDGGEVIVTDAQGAVDLVRGALTPDGEPLFTLTDANTNPGRTVSLLSIDDSNVVGAGEPGSIRVTRTTAGIAVTLRSLGAGVEMQEVVTVPGGAAAATFGKWWVRNDVPNVPMFTDDAGVDHVLLYASGISLQSAYDGGETVTLDAQGAIDVTRGALCADGESALQLIDANANPGRTVATLFISDANVVAAATPLTPSLEVRTSTVQTNILATSTDVGALGPTISMFHNSASPAVSDVVYTLNSFAKDNGGGTKEVYREEVSVIDQDAAAYDALYQMKIRKGAGGISVLARVMQMIATNPAADAGSIWINDVAAGANPPFTRRAGSDFGAAQAVDRVQDNNGASTLWRVDGDGDGVLLQDIEAAGGYRKTLGPYTHALVANQTDVVLTYGVTGNAVVAFAGGSITGISGNLDAAVTAGTLTLDVHVNGGPSVFSLSFTAADGVTKIATQAKDVDAIVAGDLVTVTYTTTLVFTGPTSITVGVEIEE